MDKFRRALSGDEPEPDDERGIMTEFSESMTFSWSTRIKGFAICFVIGVVCSILGSALLAIPSSKGLTLFALFYTVGNILSLSSTCFLMGPCNQLKKMFAETRIFATIIVVVCIVLTLMSALWWKKAGLAILFCILQFVALTWYSLSYIPFARDAVKKCFASCLT